eukprot:6692681-Pyramimonas_sp.AAC.1
MDHVVLCAQTLQHPLVPCARLPVWRWALRAPPVVTRTTPCSGPALVCALDRVLVPVLEIARRAVKRP